MDPKVCSEINEHSYIHKTYEWGLSLYLWQKGGRGVLNNRAKYINIFIIKLLHCFAHFATNSPSLFLPLLVSSFYTWIWSNLWMLQLRLLIHTPGLLLHTILLQPNTLSPHTVGETPWWGKVPWKPNWKVLYHSAMLFLLTVLPQWDHPY